MKKVAIFKIVLWSIVATFLIGMFITITVTDGFMRNFSLPFYMGWNERNLEIIREQEFLVEEIDNIDIKWTSANVNISPTDGDKIIVIEKARGNMDEKELLQISKKNGTLFMEQGKLQRGFFIFGIGKNIVNEIKLPVKQYSEIKTRMTSGKLEINDIEANTIESKMTSGWMEFEGLICENLITDITSGKADIYGSFFDINAKSTSGMINIETDIVPSTILLNITSGKATITIPDNDGFTLGKNLTAGLFNTDFKLDDFNRYKNGERQYSMKMTSGMMELLKK